MKPEQAAPRISFLPVIPGILRSCISATPAYVYILNRYVCLLLVGIVLPEVPVNFPFGLRNREQVALFIRHRHHFG